MNCIQSWTANVCLFGSVVIRAIMDSAFFPHNWQELGYFFQCMGAMCATALYAHLVYKRIKRHLKAKKRMKGENERNPKNLS